MFNLEWATLAFPRTNCGDHRDGVGGHAAGRTLEARSGQPCSYSGGALKRSQLSLTRGTTRAPVRTARERMTASGNEDPQESPANQEPAPKFRVLGPWAGLHSGRGYPGGGALAWREAQPGVGLARSPGRSAMLVGEGRGPVGEGRGGSGAVPRALFARGPACGPRNLLRLAYRAYLGLLFRHGCATTAAANAAGTGGTGAGESRSLPRRSPAATVAGSRFIPKSRRAGWPRGVTWSGACTRRVPRAAGARWPAAIPDGCECVTGRVRRPGARRAPGTRDSRS